VTDRSNTTQNSQQSEFVSLNEQKGQAPGHLRLAILLLTLLGLSAYLGTVLPVFAPHLQQHYDITNRQLGTLLSCGAMGGLIALPFIGLLVGWLGVQRVVQISLLGTGGGLVLCAIVRHVVLLEASLVIVGTFGGALTIAAISLLVNLYPAWKRRMLAITFSACYVPAIIFPPLAQYMLSLTAPGQQARFALVLHLPFGAVGLVLIGGGLLLGVTRGADLSSEMEETGPLKLRNLLSWSTFLIVFLAGLHAASDSTLYGWMPKFMTGTFPYLPLGTGVVLALYSLGYMIARSLQATLPERVGQRAFLTLSGPLGGLVVLVAIWRGDALMVGLLYPLAGMLWCLEYASLLSEIQFESAAYFSAILAGANLVGAALGIAQLNLAGWIADLTSSLQWAMTPAAAGFIAFGILAALSGLGRGSVSPSRSAAAP